MIRSIALLLAAALLLSACASGANVKASGSSDGRYSRGTAGVGVKF
jgi:hypothetical protein